MREFNMGIVHILTNHLVELGKDNNIYFARVKFLG